jgi:ATP-dependent DNA helicase PIF1
VLCVASSGIAALLLPGGRTSHSRLSIPIQVKKTSTCHIKKNSDPADLIRNTTLIIWDEVPMQHRHCLEAVDRTFRDILDKYVLFGGLPVVIGDNFAQIPSVVTLDGRPETVETSLVMSAEV